MLLLNINRKTYTGSPMTLSHLTLGELERSNWRSLRFWSLTSCNGAELGHMLLLNINRKEYMGSPMTLSYLTLGDLERSNSRSRRFWSRISRKGTELGHMLLLNINRNAYKESGLQRSKSRSLNFEELYLVKKQSEAIWYSWTLTGKHIWEL